MLSLLFFVEDFKHLDRRCRNTRTGTEDSGYTGFVKEVIVLSGNDTAGCHHDILAAELAKFFYDLRNKSLVSCSQRRYTENVHVILHSL